MRTGEGSTTFGSLVKEYKVSEGEAGLTSNPSNVPSPDDSVATDSAPPQIVVCNPPMDVWGDDQW